MPQIILEETTTIYMLMAVTIDDEEKVWCEGSRKVAGGLRHFYGRYPLLAKEQLLRELGKSVLFTPRPYRLGQSCDGTTGACVLALYLSYCRAFNRSPEDLYQQAYPAEDGFFTQEKQAQLLKKAQWEGVVYPPVWDEAARAGLIKSLTTINYHSLTNELTKLPEYARFEWSTGSFSQIKIPLENTINFDLLQEKAINNLIANLNDNQNRQRWTRAFERARSECLINDLMTWNGEELQICSRTSGNLYRTRANFCECPAYKEGFPCYHRAAAKIMIEQDRLTEEI